MLCLVTQSCPTLCDPMDCSLWGFSVHEDSPGKNTGAGCHALLQGILPIQGLNPGVLHSGRFFIVWNTRESQNRLLLSHKREWNDAICSNMDGPRDCHTESRKSSRERQISYDIAYMWNQKEMVHINLVTKQKWSHRCRK